MRQHESFVDVYQTQTTRVTSDAMYKCDTDVATPYPDCEQATELYYRPQTKFAKVMFLHLSVSHSVHRGGGACVVAGGACVVVGGRRGCGGCAWLQGVCMVAGGCAWLQGVCMVAGDVHGCGGDMHGCGGMHGCRGCTWLWGACMVAGGHAWLQGACVAVGGPAWWWGGVRGIRRDAVNERPVRILLECILVLRYL